MNCDVAREMIHPLLDEELESTRKSEIEIHMRGCVGCAEFYHELMELRKTIQGGAPYYAPPEHLAGSIRTALRSSSKPEASTPKLWPWAAIAASLFFAAVSIWGVVALRSSGSGTNLLAQEVVSSHVRSLMPGHLVDVPSSDQHTVKPWFNGKLDFSPTVKDFVSEGFALTGGRLDYLDRRPVAALVYRRRQHIINLFVWPSSAQPEMGEATFAANGYNIVHWAQLGMTHWAVSDLNANELRDFEQMYRK